MPTILEPASLSSEIRLLSQVASLEARVASIERYGARVPVFAGTPSAATGTEGSMGGDTNNRLWLRVGGSWKSVAIA